MVALLITYDSWGRIKEIEEEVDYSLYDASGKYRAQKPLQEQETSTRRLSTPEREGGGVYWDGRGLPRIKNKEKRKVFFIEKIPYKGKHNGSGGEVHQREWK